MKKSILFLLILILVASCSPGKTSFRKPETIRILSYNVKNCNGMDGVTDYRRVAEIIRRINPDVVALQELDSATMRSKGVVVLDTLAKLTGMHQTFGASITYQGGKYGVGVLSVEKPRGWKRVKLPGREEERSVLIVEFRNFVLGCTHFSLSPDDRLASVAVVNEAARSWSKPVFLAGDINANPSSEVIRSFSRDWQILNDTSAYTIPSDKPRRCIDYVMALRLTGLNFVARKAVVEQEPVASDHLPVWVDVEIFGRR